MADAGALGDLRGRGGLFDGGVVPELDAVLCAGIVGPAGLAAYLFDGGVEFYNGHRCFLVMNWREPEAPTLGYGRGNLYRVTRFVPQRTGIFHTRYLSASREEWGREEQTERCGLPALKAGGAKARNRLHHTGKRFGRIGAGARAIAA